MRSERAAGLAASPVGLAHGERFHLDFSFSSLLMSTHGSPEATQRVRAGPVRGWPPRAYEESGKQGKRTQPNRVELMMLSKAPKSEKTDIV